MDVEICRSQHAFVLQKKPALLKKHVKIINAVHTTLLDLFPAVLLVIPAPPAPPHIPTPLPPAFFSSTTAISIIHVIFPLPSHFVFLPPIPHRPSWSADTPWVVTQNPFIEQLSMPLFHGVASQNLTRLNFLVLLSPQTEPSPPPLIVAMRMEDPIHPLGVPHAIVSPPQLTPHSSAIPAWTQPFSVYATLRPCVVKAILR